MKRQEIFMFGLKSAKSQGRIDSLIGSGTRVEGNIIFSGGLRVDGEVKGSMQAADDQQATLVVSEQARVEGEVRVGHVVVNGTIVGPVYATEFLELQARSRVTGDVHYNVLEMHLGAIVEGRLVHAPSSSAPRMVELKLAKSS